MEKMIDRVRDEIRDSWEFSLGYMRTMQAIEIEGVDPFEACEYVERIFEKAMQLGVSFDFASAECGINCAFFDSKPL